MNNRNPASVMQRVLVAMDSPAAFSLLPAAADLAAQFQAELQGLFVEDTDLLRLSGLPFAEEVCSSSAVARPITREAVERRLRVLAEQLRRSLAESARQADVRWSFVIARGTIQRLAQESTRESDMLLLPQRAPPAILARGSMSASLANAPIAIVYDGSPEAERALAIAGPAAARQRRSVFVILAASDDSTETLRQQAYRSLQAHGIDVRFAGDRVSDERDLRQTILLHPCSLLLIPANTQLLQGLALSQLVADISPLVGLVR